jgi:DNA gyrase subunit A
MDEKDRVIAFEVLDPTTDVLTVAANGLGKRTAIDLFPLQGRGGKGVVAMKLNNKTGNIVGAGVVRADDTVILVSSGGILIRIPASQISKIGRGTQGVTLMRLGPKERVATMAIIPAKDPLEPEVGDMDQTNGHAPADEVKVMVKAPGM